MLTTFGKLKIGDKFTNTFDDIIYMKTEEIGKLFINTVCLGGDKAGLFGFAEDDLGVIKLEDKV